MNLNADYRPTNFNELVGQEHLLNNNGILTNMLLSKQINSMIFYGPPGTGKTSTAMILAQSFGLNFYTLNATNLSLNGVVSNKKISLSDLLKDLVIETPNKFVLYLRIF